MQNSLNFVPWSWSGKEADKIKLDCRVCPISSGHFLIANFRNYFTGDLELPSDKGTNQLIIRFVSSAIGKIWKPCRDKLYELTASRLSAYLVWLSFRFGLLLFCHIYLIQKCSRTWDKAGDTPSMVTAIIATGGNWTIDCNASQACNVVIKVFTCIKTAWNRVKNMFATVLTTITTIWRPGFNFTNPTRHILLHRNTMMSRK